MNIRTILSRLLHLKDEPTKPSFKDEADALLRKIWLLDPSLPILPNSFGASEELWSSEMLDKLQQAATSDREVHDVASEAVAALKKIAAAVKTANPTETPPYYSDGKTFQSAVQMQQHFSGQYTEALARAARALNRLREH